MGNQQIQTVIYGVLLLVSYFFAPPLSGKAERYNDLGNSRLGCASLVVGFDLVLKSSDSAKRCQSLINQLCALVATKGINQLFFLNYVE